MAYRLSRFTDATAEVLEPGERVLGGTWARTPGSYGRERAFGTLAGQLGRSSAGAIDLPRSFEVAVTDRRILFFSRSPWTARPSKLVAELGLGDVISAEVTGRTAGVLGATIRSHRGDTVRIEVAKAGARPLIESFVATVNRARSTGGRPAGHVAA